MKEGGAWRKVERGELLRPWRTSESRGGPPGLHFHFLGNLFAPLDRLLGKRTRRSRKTAHAPLTEAAQTAEKALWIIPKVRRRTREGGPLHPNAKYASLKASQIPILLNAIPAISVVAKGLFLLGRMCAVVAFFFVAAKTSAAFFFLLLCCRVPACPSGLLERLRLLRLRGHVHLGGKGRASAPESRKTGVASVGDIATGCGCCCGISTREASWWVAAARWLPHGGRRSASHKRRRRTNREKICPRLPILFFSSSLFPFLSFSSFFFHFVIFSF